MAEVDLQKTFNIHDAKTNLSKLIERAYSGEEIIIAKAGQPRAKLVPITPVVPRRRQPGGLKLTGDIPDSVWFDPMPEAELELWQGKRLEKYGL